MKWIVIVLTFFLLALAMLLRPLSHDVLAASATAMPPGTVVAYVGSDVNIPSGWLLCDGRALKQADAPQLFAVIKQSHGNGVDLKTGQKIADFNLPDYRGRFLRGADLGSGNDPDAVRRQPSQSGGEPHGVGSYQPDQNKAHTHGWETRNATTGGPGKSPVSSDGSGARADVSLGSSGGSESRPRNIAVNFIIKL